MNIVVCISSSEFVLSTCILLMISGYQTINRYRIIRGIYPNPHLHGHAATFRCDICVLWYFRGQFDSECVCRAAEAAPRIQHASYIPLHLNLSIGFDFPMFSFRYSSFCSTSPYDGWLICNAVLVDCAHMCGFSPHKHTHAHTNAHAIQYKYR